MDWIILLKQYAGLIGMTMIAVATIIAVIINLRYAKKADLKMRRDNSASFSSAIASELIDNSHNLIELYFEISSLKPKSNKITMTKQLDTSSYKTLLAEIGQLGPDLSFIVVDVYSDISKLKTHLSLFNNSEIIANRDDLLPEIQTILVKVISTAIIMYGYADYMSGKKWLRAIIKHRILWLEQTINDFCQYIGETDQKLDFTPVEENDDMIFSHRFKNKKKRDTIQKLLITYERLLYQMPTMNQGQAQRAFRALGYKLNNTFTIFLGLEPKGYARIYEDAYKEFLLPLKGPQIILKKKLKTPTKV